MNLIKRSPYHHKFVAFGATFVDLSSANIRSRLY